MFGEHRPNPILSDEERELLDSAPEECLRRAVQRGALSLDRLTEGLSPRVAAVVRSIATGERLLAPDLESEPAWGTAGRSHARSMEAAPSRGSERGRPRPAAIPHLLELARSALSNHPQLARMLDEQVLTPDEALEAARAIDHTLGRYPTGTRYAAP